jgi:hypothetical protein
MASENDTLSLDVDELLNALKKIKGGTLAMASENDKLRPGVELLNALKLVGEVVLLPGSSLLMQGKVPQGGVHAILGVLAWKLLGRISGPVGWVLLAANSFAKSTSGKYLHDYLIDPFRTEYMEDALITGKVKAALAKGPDASALAISVETTKGTVQLSGTVESEEEKKKAESIAHGVDGVKVVENKLSVEKEETVRRRTGK